MTTADEPGGTGYGDVSEADGVTEHGEPPMDESAFDEAAPADEPAEGDDIYANPPVDSEQPMTDGEDG